jgi:signal transduction histidine kinase
MKIRKITDSVSSAFGIYEQDLKTSFSRFAYKLKHQGIVRIINEVLITGQEKTLEERQYNGSWFETRVSPYLVRRVIKGVVISFFDVSEMKALKEGFQNVKIESERLHNEWHAISTFVSKQLNALVENSVEGMSSKEALPILHSLIESFETFDEINRFPIDIESVDVDVLTKEVVSEFAGSDTRIVIAPNLGRCQADREGYKRVIRELLKNALASSDRKNLVVTITAVKNHSSELVLLVRDSGAGIAVKALEALFALFERSSLPAREHYATWRQAKFFGFGLSVCDHLVRKMCGRIWVESELGVGSTFYVSFPLKD